VKLNELKPAPGSKKTRRRVGRGLGSGRGKTAGRGQKGQKSRSGFSGGAGWEGGRSRLIMRLPKRGFNREKDPYQVINLADLNGFAEGDTVNGDSLRARGLVRRANAPIKLLGNGALEVRKLKVEVDAASRSAAAAVEASGGTIAVRTDSTQSAEAAGASGAPDGDAVGDAAGDAAEES